MIRRVPVDRYLEIDTDLKTIHLVTQVTAAEGEGDVILIRQDLTALLTLDTEKTRKLRHLFTTNGT